MKVSHASPVVLGDPPGIPLSVVLPVGTPDAGMAV